MYHLQLDFIRQRLSLQRRETGSGVQQAKSEETPHDDPIQETVDAWLRNHEV
jgi:hypothetical protein